MTTESMTSADNGRPERAPSIERPANSQSGVTMLLVSLALLIGGPVLAVQMSVEIMGVYALKQTTVQQNFRAFFGDYQMFRASDLLCCPVEL